MTTIRENIPEYISELKNWIGETKDTAPEDMVDFFTARLDGYEEHMLQWEKAYEKFAEMFCDICKNCDSDTVFVDLGCGTGLELDFIFKFIPDLAVIGIDLNQMMLDRMCERHSGRNVSVVCGDYFGCELPKSTGVISFESLHHFSADKKLELYKRIYDCLNANGFFLNGDYVACCTEEENILFGYAEYKRKRFSVPPGQFIHIDTPMYYEKELELMRKAGFCQVDIVAVVDGVTIICAKK